MQSKAFVLNIMAAKQDFCSIMLGSKQDFFSKVLDAKQDFKFCSNILGTRKNFFSNILDAKEYCVQTCWVQSKTFVQMFVFQSKAFDTNICGTKQCKTFDQPLWM